MRILLDYRPALRQRTGVGEWVHELARSLVGLQKAGDPEARDLDLVIWSASLRDRLQPDAMDDLAGARFIDRRLPVRPLAWAWNRLGWPAVELLASERFDVVHATSPLLVPSRAPLQVCTVHDLDFLEHPERTWGEMRRDYPTRVPIHVRRADLVVTVSEHTRQQVHRALGVPASRTVTCRAGVPSWISAETPPPPAARGYILFVGTLEPRKNVVGLLEAYGKLLAGLPSAPSLVLAGRLTDAAAPWLDTARAAPLGGCVEIRGYVPDADRRALYAGAAMLVLPSFEEGLGLPALEALALGVPVVASTRGALPEVVGGAGLLADPGDSAALCAQMQRVLCEPGLASRMREDGLRRAREFDWDASARSLLSAFRQTLADRGRARQQPAQGGV